MTSEFTALDLSPELVQAVDNLGYTTPTPIQIGVIPLMLAGDDVIGQAQTGTGKTAAFALPIIQNLDPDQSSVQALVMAPTRELAMQVADAMNDYGKTKKVRIAAVYGGQPYPVQIRKLKTGVDIVVGTPGRLLDLINKRVLDLSGVRTVILDEADEMLSMGFIEDIETILAEIPAEHQTALFSATMPTEIRRLADRYMHTPKSVSIENKNRTVDATDQRYYLVHEKDKTAALTRLFEMEEITSALIFARTKIGTNSLALELTMRGYPAEALNGDMSQDARESTMNRMRENKIKVLVATDVAARGLDIDNISHVFNYDLPEFTEIYVHRIGRTGRAGKTGVAITLVTPRQQSQLRRIEAYTRKTITLGKLPTAEDILTYRDERLLENMMVWLKRGRCLKEKDAVTKLAEEGYDPLDIAAAALKLAQANEKRNPVGAVEEVQPEMRSRDRYRSDEPHSRGRSRSDEPRRSSGSRSQGRSSHEEGMVRLTFNAGKSQGIRPQDVVGTIAHFAEMPGSRIGAIRIQDRETMVDIPQEFVTQVLAKNGKYQIRKTPIVLERA
ncbi:MAG: DEAD/DEAH box helicase [Anaerolineaceae bacterium]